MSTSSSATRYVLITGCSPGGIGHALAMEYHRQGLHVIATARRLEVLSDLRALGITTLQLDVTDKEAIRAVHDEIDELTSGRLDLLINNAGFGYTVAVTDMHLSDVRSLFETNVIAPIALVQAFAHMLIASGDGRIVQMGSIAGFAPIPFGAAYNMSKAALMALSNTLRVEMAPFNVKVIHAIVGRVKTEIVKPRSIPVDSLYRPMEHIFQTKRIGVSQEGAMSATSLAHELVPETLRSNPRRWVWAGSQTWVPWFFYNFLGQSGFDWLMRKMFGFAEFEGVYVDGEVRLVHT